MVAEEKRVVRVKGKSKVDKRRLLTPSELALAETFSGKGASRKNLKTIRITSEFTEATDGIVLGRIEKTKIYEPDSFPKMPGVPEGGFLKPVNVIFPAEKIRNLKIPKEKTLPILSCACLSFDGGVGSVLAVTDLSGVQTTKPEEGPPNFPDTDSVIPKTSDNDLTIQLDAKILSRILSFLSKHAKSVKNSRPFLLRIPKDYEDTDPLRLEFETEEEQKGFALIMPMRK